MPTGMEDGLVIHAFTPSPADGVVKVTTREREWPLMFADTLIPETSHHDLVDP